VTISSEIPNPEDKATWWDKFKFKMFLRKMQWILHWHDVRDKQIRKKYCRHGYHKMSRGYLEFSEFKNTKRVEHVEFLKCHHCNWKFFAHLKDKQKYQRMKKREGVMREASWKQFIND